MATDPTKRAQTVQALSAAKTANTAQGPSAGGSALSFLGHPLTGEVPTQLQTPEFQPTPQPLPVGSGPIEEMSAPGDYVSKLLNRLRFLGQSEGYQQQQRDYDMQSKAHGRDMQKVQDIDKMKPFNDAIAAREAKLAQMRAQGQKVGPLDLPPVSEDLLPKNPVPFWR